MFSLKFNDSTDVSRVEKMATIFGVYWGLRGHSIKTDLLNTCGLFGRVKHYNGVGRNAL